MIWHWDVDAENSTQWLLVYSLAQQFLNCEAEVKQFFADAQACDWKPS